MMNSPLPKPDDAALAHSHALVQIIQSDIAEAGGWISFARYMHQALYAPGLGYYSGGAKKFGQSGDFVTAPEISPLFAQTLARQVAQVLRETSGDILELGAGTGSLAIQLLLELEALGQLPQSYFILEVSAYLREVQSQQMVAQLPADLMARVRWIDQLPDTFSGMVLGNEVLDALPVHLIHMTARGVMERGVGVEADQLVWKDRPLQDAGIMAECEALDLPAGYITEFCPAASALVASLGAMLQQGVMLWIDYGFPQHEYYHPQRHQGTLICHYRHYAHSDPFLYPGLQDITAHVNFSAIHRAAIKAGLTHRGYVSQAQFLINCGITDVLSRVSPHDLNAYVPLAAAAQKLLSPAEMGELFKVVAFSKACDYPLLGFVQGDKSHMLGTSVSVRQAASSARL